MLKFATALTAAGLLVSSMSASASAQPITPAHDGAPVVRVASPPKSVKPQFKRQRVHLVTNEAPGTIIIDTNNKFLYLVESRNRATRYGIGVGREGFGWSGVVKIGRKAEWPTWTPPAEMRVREAAKGHIIPAFQEGGEDNPLGARAMYLYKGGRDTIFRIHGTTQPWTIGLNMSSGCIRMMNKDVIDLYDRAPVGTKVIVIGPGNKQGEVSFEDRGIDVLRTLFGG
ncbi:lipoprotein-anchoring transpeptidase ErfK/SrfK [Rhizobium tibeticum]|uniref:Lipoprotein-anchoring transpeptidase ErfK/SrfK n=1 Tax=Rhizobium tibeticum TaxID=501024 RepID=A0A1H8CLP4_9HYPH|nr:L,D-transpeptidase [Rhizobium tibeticum]MDP9808351.1 lipoprotein-anchoring transpeptidase ErfK/SrfK [Rhizobium tibeticum]SEH48135.1 putative L,D-transpeptidase ErfK/SrfK precursor [Rhizobium tibeticum]SEM95354.1 Lipoprotein-anchoring transpeptidase ErfK/SrfK [Rhizobium tibeticum]